MSARLLCVGHAVQDFVFYVTDFPAAASKYRAHGFDSVGGGPAATAAVTIARLGGRATLAARLGRDPIGETIAAELSGFGVDIGALKHFDGYRSSLSSVLVDQAGERQIVNYLDTDLPGDAAWLAAIDLAGFDAVLADCRWPEGAAAILTRARAAGLPAILDADLPLNDRDELLGCATHLAFSAAGLADFTGSEHPEAMLAEVAARFGVWSCVTLGADGVLIADQGGLVRIPAESVAVHDTLGAGDVWHGAFALAIAQGDGEAASVRFANKVAAFKVSRPGGRRAIPTADEIS